MMSKDHLLLKWGTIKGYHVSDPHAKELIKRYIELGASASAMLQEDTPEQKDILCELITIHEGRIENDWSGEEYTKAQAIEYIRNYSRR
jgi:hypothetical protein